MDLITDKVLEAIIDSVVREPEMYSPPPFTEHISMLNPKLKFPTCLEPLYPINKFFGGIAAKPENFKTFEKRGSLYFMHDQGQTLLCIPNSIIEQSSVQEAVISHAHSLLAHLGARKTFWYLRKHVWWLLWIWDNLLLQS